MNLFVKSLVKGITASTLTFLLYQFFYIEFVRSTIEDMAFDTMNWFALSKIKENTSSPNTFVLKVDDKYLMSKKLLDENNETTYGYIFPRNHLSQIVNDVDILVKDIDKENYPSALFIDYDLSYLSDPQNITMSVEDKAFIDVLKKDRSYTIYLPMTANHNFIYFLNDEKIQAQIKSQKIKFVSVGLTTASDDVSRRYYPYETYKNKDGNATIFTNIAISLWNDEKNKKIKIDSYFSQEGLSLIENRIIFKDSNIIENKNYTTWQSNWNKLFLMSANYPLDMIYEEDLRDAIIMVGAAHHLNSDTFDIDAFENAMSGVEMHANALMTLYYLDGKLNRLPLIYSLSIVFTIIIFIDILLGLIYIKLNNYINGYNLKKSSYKLTLIQKLFKYILSDQCNDVCTREDFQDRWLVWLSMLLMLFISYKLLVDEKVWFNWMIPTLMSATYMITMFLLKPFRGKY